MKSLSISLGGHRIQIRSDADPEYLEKLGAEVTERYTAIRRRSAGKDQEFRAMALVALGLLDEAAQAQDRTRRVTERTREFVAQMIAHIDELLAGKEG